MPNTYGEKTFQEVIEELQALNPQAQITTSLMGDGVVSKVPLRKLNLPRDFYITRNGCISNMGHTESGFYWTLKVDVTGAEMVQPRTGLLSKLKQNLFTSKLKTPVVNEVNREM